MKVKSLNDSSFLPHSETAENGARNRRTSLISCVKYEILISSSLFLDGNYLCHCHKSLDYISFLLKPVKQTDKPFAMDLMSLMLSLCKCSYPNNFFVWEFFSLKKEVRFLHVIPHSIATNHCLPVWTTSAISTGSITCGKSLYSFKMVARVLIKG